MAATTEEKKNVTDPVEDAQAKQTAVTPGMNISGSAAPQQQQQPQQQQSTTQTTPAASTIGTSQTPAQTQTTSTQGQTGNTTTTTTKVTYTAPKFKEAEYAPDFKPLLDDWAAAAREQQINTIDYGTNRGVEELQRAQEDAKQNFQTMRNQVATNEQKALDNQALYAEARGDKGGIGAAQYAAIQNTAAINTLAVNQQQTKLATDTARQIADLRAQGEYKKADALLSITQNYLSQLLSLKQWALSFNLSVDEFNNSLKQWEVNYEMQVAQLTGEYRGVPTYAAQQDQLERLSKSGYALLQAGVMPSEEQLAAMGMTRQEAYYWMQGNGIYKIYGDVSGLDGATGTGGSFGYSGGGSYSGGSSSSTSSSSSSSNRVSGTQKTQDSSDTKSATSAAVSGALTAAVNAATTSKGSTLLTAGQYRNVKNDVSNTANRFGADKAREVLSVYAGSLTSAQKSELEQVIKSSSRT